MTDDTKPAPVLVFQRREGRDIEDEKASLRAEAVDYGVDSETCERVISVVYLTDWLTSLSVQNHSNKGLLVAEATHRSLLRAPR